MRIARIVVAVACLAVISIGLGCASLSHYVTPATVDREAVEYAVSAGVADANSYAGYPNLAKANALKDDVDAAHSTIQQGLQQRMERDNLRYSICKEAVVTNVRAAVQREQILFGEKGLLSLGLSLAGVGTLTGLLGLMRKRPGDITPQEMESALETATGKTSADLSAKQRQFAQLVIGVKKLFDVSTQSQRELFKSLLNGAEDTDTQIAVATTKKELGL